MTGVLGTSGGGAAGVTSVTAGNGITVTGTTTLTVSATGVNSVSAGTGISVSGSTSLTVTNTGVTSLVAGTNVSVSGATGTVTVNAPAFGTTITASTIGGTAAAGTSTSVAREDHKHAFPAGAAPASLLVASTQVTGTSASPALADHVHAMPGSAVAGASAVGDTAATGSATTISRSDHKHSREAFGTPIAVTGGATAASGSATTIARSDHVHSTASMPVLLASTTLGSAAASYTFSSIPQTYTHLKLYFSTKSTTSGTLDYAGIYLNTDGLSTLKYANNYSTNGLNNYFDVCPFHGAGNKVAYHTIGYCTFENYTSLNYKPILANALYNSTATASPSYSISGHTVSQLWLDTTAISAVKILLTSGANLAAGSQFWLYGYP